MLTFAARTTVSVRLCYSNKQPQRLSGLGDSGSFFTPIICLQWWAHASRGLMLPWSQNLEKGKASQSNSSYSFFLKYNIDYFLSGLTDKSLIFYSMGSAILLSTQNENFYICDQLWWLCQFQYKFFHECLPTRSAFNVTHLKFKILRVTSHWPRVVHV